MADPRKTSLTQLYALSDLIRSSIEQIESAASSSSADIPSIDEPFNLEREGILENPTIMKATATIQSAASQLIATTRPAGVSLILTAIQFHVSSALRVVLETHVAEAIREAGSQGLHVNDIAAYTKTDPRKLARILRLLVTNHIFTEVSPDVFANNRISSILDSGKPVSAIVNDPEGKYDGTNGLAAFLNHCVDDAMKSSVCLADVIADPKSSASGEANEAAFNKGLNTDLEFFPWLESPGNSFRLRRFGVAMGLGSGNESVLPPSAFDWNALPEASTVVDVGGGIGVQSAALAKDYPKLQFIVQDRDAVIKDARKQWESRWPDLLRSGPHNFFQPQSVKSPTVYFLRNILHDWSDEKCVQILKPLRESASSETRIVIVDTIIQYACAESALPPNVEGSLLPPAPKPLLANGGAGNSFNYLMDMQMLSFANGCERTVDNFNELLKLSGWRLVKVHHDPEYRKSVLVAVPV